jgi:hypothetical protein
MPVRDAMASSDLGAAGRVVGWQGQQSRPAELVAVRAALAIRES